MVIKFDPEGRVLMTMGRKPEAFDAMPVRRRRQRARRRRGAGGPGAAPAAPPAPVGTGVPGDNFNRPTDVAWDAAGQHLRGRRLRELAHREVRQERQVPEVVGLARLRRRGSSTSRTRSRSTRRDSSTSATARNNRIQVFDGEGTFKTQFVNVGAPSAICITPGPRQFLYASNSNPSTSMDNGEIYKMTLDGKIVGKFGTAGKLLKEFGSVHEMDCRSENELYVGEITNWRVQKLTLKPR